VIPGRTYLPEDFLQIAWRRKWLIVVPLILCSFAGFVWSANQPDLFRSETLILVVPQRIPESYVRSTVTLGIEQRLQSISQQILSHSRLERIIRDLDLYRQERATAIIEDVVNMMRANITVQIIRGDAFRLAYVSRDPVMAMKVTERLTSLFIDENLRDRAVMADGTSRFLESQLEDARHRLIAQEKRLEAYRRAHGGELPSQLESNLQALHNAQMQVQSMVDSLARDRDRQLLLERTIADELARAGSERPAAEIGGSPPPAGSAAAQLESAKKILDGLLLRLKPEHPDVVSHRRLMRELARKAEAEALEVPAPDPGPGPAVSESRARLAQMRLELATLVKQIEKKQQDEANLRDIIATYQARLNATPTRENEMIELMRDYSTLQEMYRGLLAKNEESKISANLEHRQIGEQFKVLDAPRVPVKPFSPDRTRSTTMGGLAGLVFGVALVALLEYRDHSLRSDIDVRAALNLPVVAMIPVMITPAERRRRTLRRIAVSVAATCAVAAMAMVAWRLAP